MSEERAETSTRPASRIVYRYTAETRREDAHTSLCIWLLLIIAFALFCMFGAACPVYGQAPLTDPPLYPLGWGIKIASSDPVDVTIGTAKNFYGIPPIVDKYGRVKDPGRGCQWTADNWPIHPTPIKQFTVYLVRIHNGVASRVSAVALPYGPCDKPATTSYTVRDAAHGFAPGDRLYVEFNAAVDVSQCGAWPQPGSPVPAPLWCGPVFTTGGVATAPAMEGFRR